MRIIVLALALALGGCASFQQKFDGFTAGLTTAYHVVTGEIVEPGQAILAIDAFDIAKVAGNKYLHLPRCPQAAACRTPETSKAVISFLRAGTADRDALKAELRANPDNNLTLVEVYRNLRNTTAALLKAVK